MYGVRNEDFFEEQQQEEEFGGVVVDIEVSRLMIAACYMVCGTASMICATRLDCRDTCDSDQCLFVKRFVILQGLGFIREGVLSWRD